MKNFQLAHDINMPFRNLELKLKKLRFFLGNNNTFNLAYTLLKYKVFVAILRAHLEPYLGFLHSEQWGKPSMRHDGAIPIPNRPLCHRVQPKTDEKNFVLKKEWYSSNLLAKYLRCETKAWNLDFHISEARRGG